MSGAPLEPSLIYNPFQGTIALENVEQWQRRYCLSDRLVRAVDSETKSNKHALAIFKTLTKKDMQGLVLYVLPEPGDGTGSPEEGYGTLQLVNLKELKRIAKSAVFCNLAKNVVISNSGTALPTTPGPGSPSISSGSQESKSFTYIALPSSPKPPPESPLDNSARHVCRNCCRLM